MAEKVTGPASYFPSIEKKYGQPMSYWFDVIADIADRKYPEQMAYLRENHNFSQAHANAVVMTARGSTSSRRVDSPDAWFAELGGQREATARAIVAAPTICPAGVLMGEILTETGMSRPSLPTRTVSSTTSSMPPHGPTCTSRRYTPSTTHHSSSSRSTTTVHCAPSTTSRCSS